MDENKEIILMKFLDVYKILRQFIKKEQRRFKNIPYDKLMDKR
jgi:hypothetical protein